MKRAWAVFGVCVVVAVSGACGGGATTGASADAPVVVVPEFTLEDQDGRPFGLHDLHGKV